MPLYAVKANCGAAKEATKESNLSATVLTKDLADIVFGPF